MLDHAGKPSVEDGRLTQWEKQIRRLADHPRVTCKVSGLVTEADWAAWTTGDIRPAWEVLLSAFGPERLMFGSDWPLCRLARGWGRWAATVEELLLQDCLPGERTAVLAGTATRFYRL